LVHATSQTPIFLRKDLLEPSGDAETTSTVVFREFGPGGSTAAGRASVPTPEKPVTAERDVYEVMVEKIYPGSAVVLINDKWRARMTPQDFEGPAGMMKKDARFKARGTLYRNEDTLCFRVRQVTQVLS
jgi:Fanconi anemia group M protein